MKLPVVICRSAAACLACVFPLLALPLLAHSQARPTATAPIRLSVFAGANGTYTGLNASRNVGITAGLDIGFRSFYGLQPAIEIRGTYPISDGSTAAEQNILGGLQVARTYARFHPYVDILFGRGQIDYQNGGYPDPSGKSLNYLKSTSNVISPGAGLDLEVTHHLAVKLDVQLQRYVVPTTASGSLYSKALTAGVVYRFGF